MSGSSSLAEYNSFSFFFFFFTVVAMSIFLPRLNVIRLSGISMRNRGYWSTTNNAYPSGQALVCTSLAVLQFGGGIINSARLWSGFQV